MHAVDKHAAGSMHPAAMAPYLAALEANTVRADHGAMLYLA